MPSVADPADIDSLRTALTGPVFAPDLPGFAEEVAGYNLAVTRRPAVVVGAATPGDVQTAVRYAAARGLPIGVHATGHASVRMEGGLAISTRRLGGVRVDPAAATVTVGAGVCWREVIEAAAPYGLAPLNGSSSVVGAVGYTLGGGLPVMGRTFGFAADHVQALDVVIADGDLHRVSAEAEPDLFWGLRGGQGNLGVVTSMTTSLLPVSRVHGGSIFYSAEHIATALHGYRQWCVDLPPEMTASIAILRLPPAPEVPEQLRGQTVAHLRVCYVGSGEQADPLLAPMRAAAPAIVDTVADMPYSAVDSIHMDPPHPMPFYQRGILLGDFGPQTVDALLTVAGPDAHIPVVVCEVRQLGGAFSRQPDAGNAVGGRDAAFILSAIGVMAPDVAEVTPGAVDAVMAAAQPWATGKTVLNFHGDPGDEADRARAWDEPTHRRLLELARRYDPNGLLRFAHAIGRTASAPVPPQPGPRG